MKGTLLFLLLIPIVQQSFGQSNYATSALTSPSDNNSFLASYGVSGASEKVDVDLFTGTARVTVPFCDLQANQLKLPVSLAYVSGRGVKVQDVANQVGLGWQLNAGGYVSRIVRGIPDENVNGYLGTGGDGHNVKATITGTTLYNSNTILDQEPDLFFVSTPYISFHFTYDDNGNVIIPNNNGYQVISNLYNFSGTGTTYFEVIDDQGNQYYFGSTAASQDGITTYTTITQQNGNTNTTSYTFPVTWYLDKIVTYNAQDQINLTYIGGAAYSVGTSLGLGVNFYSFNPGHYTTYWNGGSAPQTNYTAPKYLSTITSAQGEVDFTYAFDRQDFAAVGRLTNITQKAYNPLTGTNSNIRKTFNLNYSYFGTTSDVNSLRLRLDTITVTGSTPSTAGPLLYSSFDYNLTTALPDRNSPQFDYWGYYNANSAVAADTWTLLPDVVNRAPYLASASSDVLIGVHNLSGEVTQIQYELNTYSNAGVNTALGGLRTHAITRTYTSNPNPVTTQYSYNDVNGNSTGMFYGFSSTGNHMHAILSVVNANYDASFSASVNIPGVTFPCWGVQTDGVTPYNTYDLAGNFIGYSAVKETAPSGGYTISQFTNFNNFADIYSITPINFTLNFLGSPTTLTSEGEGNAPTVQETIPGAVYSYDYSYKRGLLLDKTVYNANGYKVTETTNTYTSLNASPTVTSYGYRTVAWGIATNTYEYYSTHVENYRLTQMVKKDFDELNTASYVQRSYAFTYCPNLRSVSTNTTTDSKGSARTETYFHADDTNIPLVTTPEQTALTTMVQGNRTNILIHETDLRNGVEHQIHNTYGLVPLTTSVNHVYLSTVNGYTGTTLVKQQLYNFDPQTSNLLSLYVSGLKPVSFQYLYNTSLMGVRAVNANRTIVNSVQPQTTSGNVNITGTNNTQTATFTTSVVAAITVAMPASGYLGQSGGATCYFSFTLTGPTGESGTLCNSSVSGYTCTGTNTITYSSMPAGTYTISVSPITNTATASVPVTFGYTGSGVVSTTTSEYFFEGFEQLGNVTTSAHTGHASYSGSYTVPYTTPNSRSYVIQWWSFANSVWNFNEQAYTGSITLTGQIDDVRVFPTDAQLTTFSFDPQLGMTGMTDSAGRSTSYQYDAYGRINLVLDNDQNILKKFDYEFQALIDPIGNSPQSGTYTRNNCAAGGTPSAVTYTVPAGKYTSVISLADANQQAVNDVAANGQNYANANGTCTFYNVAASGAYTRNNCGTGFGQSVTYTVPAAKYNSTVSQAAANTLAQNDVTANGQNYANANGVCTFFNIATSGTYPRNNCTCLYTGSSVTYTVTANTYQSTVSQAAANTLAQNDVNANGQTYANSHGTCTTTCTSPQSKVISCVCKAGTYGLVSQVYNAGKCTTSYGYSYPDGTYTVTSSSSTTGPCD